MSVDVRVLFFGATAAVVGERNIALSLPEGSISGTVFNDVVSQYPALSSHKLLFSINQTYASGDEQVNDGDELAIFTAVSGG